MVFESTATNLVTGLNVIPRGQPDELYLRNLATGVTTPITYDSGGNPLTVGLGFVATPDDRYVFFRTDPQAPRPGAELLAQPGIFVYDTELQTTTAVLLGFPGVPVNTGALDSVTSNGELLGFTGGTEGLVPGSVGASVYVQDRQTNQTLVLDAAPATGADAASPGTLPPVQAGDSPEIAVSSDGSVIAFSSDASNLAPGDLNDASNVYVENTVTGKTTLISNLPSGFSGQPSINANGQVVAFTNDVDGPFPPFVVEAVPFQTISNVYVENLSTGAPRS